MSSRRDLFAIDAQTVAFLKAAVLNGRRWDKDVGLSLNLWKVHCSDVIETGQAHVTAGVLKRILGKLGDEVPLPAETRARLALHLDTRTEPSGVAGRLLRDKQFQEFYERELRTIEDQRRAKARQTAEQIAGGKQPASGGARPVRHADVCLWCLPATGSVFVGREKQLQELDSALESANTHVVTVAELPGCGKSALINQWLSRLEPEFGGAEKVFGWSFAGVESRSAAMFLEHALDFFGGADPLSGKPEMAAVRLADLIRQRRSILVLDALEAVQDNGTHAITADVVRILVRELAQQLDGLLVLTTRFECPDIAHLRLHSRTLRLPRLSLAEGQQLLDELGIRSPPDLTRTFVERCDGHGLCLRVFAGFARCLGGDMSRALGFRLDEADRYQRGELSALVQAYDGCLAPLDRALLRVISTYSDGLLPGEALSKLMQEPEVVELCDGLAGCDTASIRVSLSALEDFGLVNHRTSRAGGVPLVNLHPLVRDHYAVRPLPETSRMGGYRCLRDFYRHLADGAGDDVAGLDYAYAAVSSGIAAGLNDEAIEDFGARLNRGREGRTWDAFGMFDQNIEVLRPLFARAWDEPVPGISEEHRAYLLYEVGFYLSSQGRLAECIAPLQASIAGNEGLGNHLWVTFALLDLAFVCLETGEIDRARAFVRQSSEAAKRLDNPFWTQACRCIEGYVALQSGDDVLADACFRETTHAGRGLAEDPFNVGIGVYLVCDYWLGREVEQPGLFPKPLRARRQNSPAWQEIHFWFKRLEQAAEQGNSLLARGLQLLARVRLQSLLLLGAKPSRDLGLEPVSVPQVRTGFDQAIETLEKSRLHHFLVPGYLTAAALERCLAQRGGRGAIDWGGTTPQQLLDESLVHAHTAYQRAVSFGARLYEVDARLELARILTVRGEVSQVDEHVREARRMIEMFSYGRRRRELAHLTSSNQLACGSNGRNGEAR